MLIAKVLHSDPSMRIVQPQKGCDCLRRVRSEFPSLRARILFRIISVVRQYTSVYPRSLR